jgi:hypothetical protein
MSDEKYETADASREEDALRTFPIEMDAEEYAAREGHSWACCSYINYRYSNPQLESWMRKFEKYLTNYELLKKARTKFLTPEEIRAAEEYENDN